MEKEPGLLLRQATNQEPFFQYCYEGLQILKLSGGDGTTIELSEIHQPGMVVNCPLYEKFTTMPIRSTILFFHHDDIINVPLPIRKRRVDWVTHGIAETLIRPPLVIRACIRTYSRC